MKNYIPSLNGLRALSIITVILGHLNVRNFPGIRIPFPLTIFTDSTLGVNVFFVISGFLITTLLIEEEKESGSINLKNFYIRRMIRIFPAYYFLLLVYLILQLSSVLHFTGRSWLSSLFYYKYLDGGDWESGHFWSLSVEEHFYLVWPLVFKFWKRGRIYFAYAVVLLVVFFRLNSYMKFLPYQILDSSVSLFQRVDAIMIGCLLALYRTRINPWVIKISRNGALPILILLAIACLATNFLTDWNLTHHWHMGLLLVPLGIGWSAGIISNFLIGLLLLVSINSKGLWFKFLNAPFMNVIGKLSYSLYLWQQLFFSDHLGPFSHFPLNLCCIVIAALISYNFIEKPFLKLKKAYETIRISKTDRLKERLGWQL
ncbi:MAG TPA: acyltransferase [Puia sp.]|nr:acyltransferase [Puia sp.]